jgi:hypothetical protein
MKTLTVRLPEALIAQIEVDSWRRRLLKSDVVSERSTGTIGGTACVKKPVARSALASFRNLAEMGL